MSKLYTFNKTVRGHLHILKEIPCEDFSASYSDECNKYYIAIVADGHGSKSCFRSAFGSKTATEVTMNCLKQFAESNMVSEDIEDRFYVDIINNPRYRQMIIKQLTDTIVAKWHDCIMEDYTSNPPSSEEIGEDVVVDDIAHIYGTTIIAALYMPKCLILIHQGDGRCDVFYENGSVEQPIPWDVRCQENVTTSLCDEDASESFRNNVIDLVEKPVMACLIGTDGVEDAYRDTYESLGGSHTIMGGVHTFYKDLLCYISNNSSENFEEYLKPMLENFSEKGKFSRSGSGDDISVSGIVNIEKASMHKLKYEKDVKKYSLDECLFWKKDELRSKTRKHSILKRRFEDAQFNLSKAMEEKESIQSQLQLLKNQQIVLLSEVEKVKIDLDEYSEESKCVSAQFEGKYFKISEIIQHFLEEISNTYLLKEKKYIRCCNDLSSHNQKILVAEEACNSKNDLILCLNENLAEAKSLFEEYDEKYQMINKEIFQIEEQINLLNEGVLL